MSLMSLSRDHNRGQDELFLEQTAELAASEAKPASSDAEPAASATAPGSPDLVARHEAMMRRATAAQNTPVEDETDQFLEDVEALDASATPADMAPPVEAPLPPEALKSADAGLEEAEVETAPVVPQARNVATPDPEGEAQGQDPSLSEEPAAPAGVPAKAAGVYLTEEDRVAALAEKMQGSVGDGGSVEDFINGLPPRPSVASQREIRDFQRRLIGGLELQKPANWPEYMMFPTYEELRRLHNNVDTPEFIKNWEQEKQLQADAMEARAREINDWIFSFGDGALNERHRLNRMKNREAAVRKRSAPIEGKEAVHSAPDPSAVTDEELYKDPHYGIRFATLLNPDPDHLNRLRQAPIAAWGHDMARTLDGGKVRVTDDEIRAVTVSAQAAQLIVMEAKARGWETLRISGDNEFCAAVKRACKEQGMGAIITRRGPLGLGPFSRPEVIMPRLPDPLGPQVPDAEQRRKEQAAPVEDKATAAALLGDGTDGAKPSEGKDAAPALPGEEIGNGPRPHPARGKARLDEVDVADPLGKEARPAPDSEPTGPIME